MKATSAHSSRPRRWTANWICADLKDGPAPYVRAEFRCPRKPRRAVAHVLVPGWNEMHVNGRRVGDAVLSPTPMQFDVHVPWQEIDLAPYLREGPNAIAFLLGNGWFNMFAKDVWGFERARWRDVPKLLCEIVVDGRVVLRSGDAWRVHESPLVYSGLRGGETWDARLEGPDPSLPGFDDAGWRPAVRCVPPGGLPLRDTARPCRAFAPVEAVSHAPLSGAKRGAVVWDFAQSLAGWTELEVVGERGAKVEIDYAEKLGPDGDIDTANIDHLVLGERFQHDEYILAGRPEGERWHARFTYHGFRWARTRVTEGRAEVRALRAIPVHADLPAIGEAHAGHPVFERLLELTRASYFANFAGGFPTDCPHREKNGWTGDAQLAMETGLWNFDGAANYAAHMQLFADAQRPNGAVPCILPCATWGYHWGTGPAWDVYLFEAPWQRLRFYGDDTLARRLYPVLRRYLAYAASMRSGGLVDYGLGDWCAPRDEPQAPVRLIVSAYVLEMARRLAFFARRFGHNADAARAEFLAASMLAALRAEFRRPGGSWAGGEPTSLGAALYFGLCETPAEAAATARLLAETVRARGHQAHFGIFGAKWVPRVLADHGYVDDAFRLFVQPDYPGWGNWVKRGATALWESWEGGESLNHIMFGDLSAWAFEFLGGIRPGMEHPGFARIELRPCFPKELDRFEARHTTPRGEIAVSWERKGERIVYRASLPRGVRADLRLPGLPVRRGVTGTLEETLA